MNIHVRGEIVRVRPVEAPARPERWCVCGALLPAALDKPSRGRPASTCGRPLCRKIRERRRRLLFGEWLNGLNERQLHVAAALTWRIFGDSQFDATSAFEAMKPYRLYVSAADLANEFDELAEDCPADFEKRSSGDATTFRFTGRCEHRSLNSVTAPVGRAPKKGAQLAGEGTEPLLPVTKILLAGAPASSAEEAEGPITQDVLSMSAPSIARGPYSETTTRDGDQVLGLGDLEPRVAHPSPRLCAVRASRALGRQHTVEVADGAAEQIVCVSPPRVDGGTSFHVEASFARWAEPLRDLAWRVHAHERLPEIVDLVDADGEQLSGAVKRPNRGPYIDVIFEQVAQLRLNPTQGLVVLLTKAEGLWSVGVADWMKRWLDRASFFALGERCPTPHHAHALGWRVRHLELAADFVGLRLWNDDAQLFTGHTKNNRRINSNPARRLNELETLEIGSRGKNRIALETHDKTGWLRQQGSAPADSVYAPTWRANGWDSAAEIRRVEVRAHGTALWLRTAKGAPEQPDIDLRNPVMLLDPEATGRLWKHATTVRRLVVRPETETLARLRHQPVDPRWGKVQQATSVEVNSRYARQLQDESSRLSEAERRIRYERAAARALAKLLTHRGLAPDAAGLAAIVCLVAALPDFREQMQLALPSGEWCPPPAACGAPDGQSA